MKSKMKVLGVLGMLLGVGATMISNFTTRKETEQYIDECVEKKLKEREEE